MELNNKVIVNKGLFNNIDVMENSLESLEKALKKDYILRLNVIYLKDNNFIIFDDNALERLFNIKDSIKKFDYEELNYISTFNILKIEDIKDIVGNKTIIININENSKTILKLFLKKIQSFTSKIIIESKNLKVLKFFKKQKYKVSYLINQTNKKKIDTIFKPDIYNIEIGLFNKKQIKVIREKYYVIGSIIKTSTDLLDNRDIYDNLVIEYNQ